MKKKIFSIFFALVLVISLVLAMTAPVLAAPTATLSPTSGPVGTSVTVSGAGWTGSETISAVTVGGVTATYSLTVDGGGLLSGTVTIPTAVGGAKDIVITGASSGSCTFTSAFTITMAATLSPLSGPVGTSVTVSGSGWMSSEAISSVTIAGIAATYSLTVDANGVLSGTVTIPTAVGGGKNVVITGASSGSLILTSAFTVTGSATFSPTSGPVGTPVTVSGSGWFSSEAISSITVGGLTAICSLTVDSNGVLVGTITVPRLAGGAKDIVITGAGSGLQTFSGVFTVTGSATFSPLSGPVGTTVTVSGSGWMSSEAISSVTVGGKTASYALTTDANGVLSGTIAVPAVTVGATDISITGTSSGSQAFSGVFTVTTATATLSPDAGPLNTLVTVNGTGWAGSDNISSVTVGGIAATYSLTVDGSGLLTGTITLPVVTVGLKDIFKTVHALTVGAKDMVITGAISGPQAIPNAYTVANYWPLLGIAVALILLIVMIVVLARRGRSRS